MPLELGLKLILPADNPYAGEYILSIGDCTGLDDLDCLAKTDMSVIELFESVTKRGRQALVAGTILWLVRRKMNDGQFAHMTFEQAVAAIPWKTDFVIEDAFPRADEGKGQGSDTAPNGSVSSPTSLTTTASGPGNSST